MLDECAMGIHDWTRVDDGAFHDFHMGWILHLKEALNAGLLPKGYYAMSEQHALQYIGDIITLERESSERRPSRGTGGVSVVDAPPRVSQRLTAQPSYRLLRRTLAVRRVTTHQIVALIEIVSPGNKDRTKHVQQFVEKAFEALRNGCNLLVVDVLPPGKYDPDGMHGAIWQMFDEDYKLKSKGEALMASYETVERQLPVAYLQRVAIGEEIPDMPLFLREGYYVNAPLQATYEQSFRGMGDYYRELLEKAPNEKRRGGSRK